MSNKIYLVYHDSVGQKPLGRYAATPMGAVQIAVNFANTMGMPHCLAFLAGDHITVASKTDPFEKMEFTVEAVEEVKSQ